MRQQTINTPQKLFDWCVAISKICESTKDTCQFNGWGTCWNSKDEQFVYHFGLEKDSRYDAITTNCHMVNELGKYFGWLVSPSDLQYLSVKPFIIKDLKKFVKKQYNNEIFKNPCPNISRYKTYVIVAEDFGLFKIGKQTI